MDNAIEFISTQLGISREQAKLAVDNYISITGKSVIEFDDIRDIMQTLILEKSAKENEKPVENSDLDEYELDYNEIESDEERNKTNNMLFIPLLLMSIGVFLVIIVSKIMKVHPIYLIGTVVSVALVYLLIDSWSKITLRRGTTYGSRQTRPFRK